MCRLAGFEPDIGFVTEDYQSAQGLVAAGIGISTVPRLSLVAQHPDVVAVPIDSTRAPPEDRRGPAAQRQPSPAAQQMLDVLRDATVTAGSARISAA